MNNFSILFACVFTWCVVSLVSGEDPDIKRNGTELILSRGFPAEYHEIVTSDGFVLGTFRIPHGRQGAPKKALPPVLVYHSLLASSDEYLVDSEEISLGYILADAGFDVWLANKRGNTYSMKHKTLSPDDPKFWDFSYDEVALLDVPAVVSYIREKTGAKSIAYVGHSEGTTIGLAAVAANPSLNDELNSLVLLAPVANLTFMNQTFTKILSDIPQPVFYDVFGHKSFLPSTKLLETLGADFCKACGVCCEDILLLICGWNPQNHNMNTSRFDVYYSHTPCGTSTKNMEHWVQNSGKHCFREYDYGNAKLNEEHYGSDQPPTYDLSRIRLPVSLFGGGMDTAARPDDVDVLRKWLEASGIDVFFHFEPDYEHMDFVWGINAHEKIYPLVIQQLKKATSN